MSQRDLFDAARVQGRAGADDAFDGTGGGLAPATKADLRRAIDFFRGLPFTAEMVRGAASDSTRQILAHPHHQNALAGLLTRLAKVGTLRKTGRYARTQRAEARGRLLTIWEHGE